MRRANVRRRPERRRGTRQSEAGPPPAKPMSAPKPQLAKHWLGIETGPPRTPRRLGRPARTIAAGQPSENQPASPAETWGTSSSKE